jgi:hypothetical protein
MDKKTLLGIRIRMFLGLPDPNRLVRGTYPDSDPKKTEDNVPTGKLYEKYLKKIIFFASLKSLKEGVGSGSAPKCHGSPTLLKIVVYSLHTNGKETK